MCPSGSTIETPREVVICRLLLPVSPCSRYRMGRPAFPYTFYSFSNIIATSSSSALSFSFYNPPSWWDLDDVSVTAHVVPEPGTLGLIALGALGLVGAVRKRLV